MGDAVVGGAAVEHHQCIIGGALVALLPHSARDPNLILTTGAV